MSAKKPKRSDAEKTYALHHVLGGCGCGNPEIHWQAIRKIAQVTEEAFGREWGPGRKNTVETVRDALTPDEMAYIIVNLLDHHFNLFTHGGSIYGSWPESGLREIGRLIDKYGTDEDDWPHAGLDLTHAPNAWDVWHDVFHPYDWRSDIEQRETQHDTD